MVPVFGPNRCVLGCPARVSVRAALICSALLLSLLPATAQDGPSTSGTVEGIVSTQSGTVKLPGVVVTIRSASGGDVAQEVSDNDGHFAAADVPAGRYRVLASLDGFQPLEQETVVEPGGHVS